MTNKSIFTTIVSLILAFCVYVIIKSTNDLNQELKVISAVRKYLIDKNNKIATGDILTDINNMQAMYDSIGYYKPKLYRLIDWGYEDIVPPEVLEKIKPYIEG